MMGDGNTIAPSAGEFRRLGLDPTRIQRMEPLRQSHGHSVYRVTMADRSYVLKYFPTDDGDLEIAAYDLLGRYGVPTIAAHGHTTHALLSEDLTTSADRRLATRADIERAETGVAVAEWYRALHAAGRRLLADSQIVPPFLKAEADALDAATIRSIGERLKLTDNPVWELAAAHVQELKHAMHSLPRTLTYGDFHWTNLALTRDNVQPLRAVVFDYHLLGIGPAYSDCRNVDSGLRGDARAAFWAAYGETDAREAVLDAPVSILYSLSVAVEQPQLPNWAVPLVQAAKTGELQEKIQRALEAIG